MARLAALTTAIWLFAADVVLAQAGSGSGGFGPSGGGGSGGGSSGGGSSGGSGSGEGDPIVVLIFFLIFGGVVVWILVKSALYHRKVRERDRRVRTASAEAAEDDAYFAAADVERDAAVLYRAAQQAWDSRDREALKTIVGKDLMVEWSRRLDDFDKKGWHNRVEVLGDPGIKYVGITNQEDDTEDRVVVRIDGHLRAYVLTKTGAKLMREGEKDDEVDLTEYWTLARTKNGWIVTSIESKAEGDHQLDEQLVLVPWADARLRDQALTELAVADSVPEGFTTADLATLEFDGDARAHALDLSLADARFGPDVLEAAARRAVSAWADAVDGGDAPLEAVASAGAVQELLYGGDASRRTRLVVRGPHVRRIRIAAVDVERQPATMTVEVEVHGRRYVENRDTADVVSGSKDSADIFTERWTLALDGPADAPWRVVDTAASPSPR